MKEEITDAFNMLIDYRLDMLHTCLPGKILSYDAGKRLAKVEPLVSLKTSKEVNVIYQAIENVPVMFPSGSIFSLRWDIARGDGCLILFSESGIGNYLNSSENIQVESDDSTRFSMTDAICVPGLFSFTKAQRLSKDNEIYIDKTGNVSIKGKEINLNGNSKSFVTHAELDAALQIYVSAVNTLFGTKKDEPSAAATLTLDISSAATTTVKTGG